MQPPTSSTPLTSNSPLYLFSEAVGTQAAQHRTKDFVTHRFQHSHAGQFGIRLKLHKSPIVGRPIGNLPSSFLQLRSMFINEGLTPIVKVCPDVVESASNFLRQVQHIPIPLDYVILTSDVRNLYPMIPNSGGFRHQQQRSTTSTSDAHPELLHGQTSVRKAADQRHGMFDQGTTYFLPGRVLQEQR